MRKKGESIIEQCIICGNTFTKVGRQKTCSPECSRRNVNNLYRDRYRKQVGYKEYRKCSVCGKEFKRQHRETICSDECREVRRVEKNKLLIEKNKQKVEEYRKCSVCGKEFKRRHSEKVCSVECKKEKERISSLECHRRRREKEKNKP